MNQPSFDASGPLQTIIDTIPATAWSSIVYPDDGEAQVTERST